MLGWIICNKKCEIRDIDIQATLGGVSPVRWKASPLIISKALSEVSRVFRRPKCAHLGSIACFKFSRLTSMDFPTPRSDLALGPLGGSNNTYQAYHVAKHWPSYQRRNMHVSSRKLATPPRFLDAHLVSESAAEG